MLRSGEAVLPSRRSILALPFAPAPRPNFLFVLVDDLRWDELACTGHPFAQSPNAGRLSGEGATFRNAFATTPLCSPSRAAFLTGQYAHRNGITDNTHRSALSHKLLTWPRLLHDAGYETAFLGKWHMGNDDSPRPGFDHWVSFPGQGESVDPALNVNGQTTRAKGYVTDVLTERAVDWLRRPRTAPFCLYLAHKAIHPNIVQRNDGSVEGDPNAPESFIAAERHKSLYANASLPHRPNYNRPPQGKPALARGGPGAITSDATILNRMRMTKAIDEGLGEMLHALERTRQLDNTVVVYTSDHGYFYGEHGLGPERRLAYEESIRIPFLLRYPPRVRAGRQIERFLSAVDVAPSMLTLAGLEPTAAMQGRSFTPLLEGRDQGWQDRVAIEYFSDTVFPRIRQMGYRAVRTRRWKRIQYTELQGMDELYDLQSDPYELNNLHGRVKPAPEVNWWPGS